MAESAINAQVRVLAYLIEVSDRPNWCKEEALQTLASINKRLFSKPKVCKFWLRKRCRFGDKCWNYHSSFGPIADELPAVNNDVTAIAAITADKPLIAAIDDVQNDDADSKDDILAAIVPVVTQSPVISSSGVIDAGDTEAIAIQDTITAIDDHKAAAIPAIINDSVNIGDKRTLNAADIDDQTDPVSIECKDNNSVISENRRKKRRLNKSNGGNDKSKNKTNNNTNKNKKKKNRKKSNKTSNRNNNKNSNKSSNKNSNKNCNNSTNNKGKLKNKTQVSLQSSDTFVVDVDKRKQFINTIKTDLIQYGYTAQWNNIQNLSFHTERYTQSYLARVEKYGKLRKNRNKYNFQIDQYGIMYTNSGRAFDYIQRYTEFITEHDIHMGDRYYNLESEWNENEVSEADLLSINTLQHRNISKAEFLRDYAGIKSS